MRGLRGSGLLFAAIAVFFTLVFVSVPEVLGTGFFGKLVSAALYAVVSIAPIPALVAVVRRTSGVEQRSWAYLAIGVCLLVAADIVWLADQQVSSDGFGTNPASYVLYVLAFIPIFMHVGLAVSTSLAGTPPLTRVRYVLDMSIAVLLVSVALLVFFLLPDFPRLSSAERPLWFVDTALSLVGTVSLVLIIGRIAQSAEPIWRRWEGKVALAAALFVGAEVMSALLGGGQPLAMGSRVETMSDLAWLAGYVLFAWAALQRLAAPAEVVGMPPMSHARRSGLRWYDVGVASSLTVAVPYVLYESRYAMLGDAEFWTLGIGTFVIAALVIARSAVLTSENGNLLVHTVVDPLTGAYNHRYFHERVAIEIERSRRNGLPVTVVLLDIDEFSRVNDTLGHQRGDQCLKRVAEVLRLQERSTDTLCRLGGDEFALIMPGVDVHAALGRTRILQATITEDVAISDCVDTVSVGIASCPVHASDRTSLVQKAKGALYWAQATGVGQVVVYDDDVVEALSPEERLHLAEEQSYMHTVESLAAAVDARDPYTQNHSRNVAELSSRLAQYLGMSDNQVRLVRIAGLLHDVGKIGVSDSILRKPGRLTAEERLMIEEHPDLGQRILSATIFKEILPWVLHHHERWDGGGYPQGLAGEQIPREARLLAICDAYDAMVSDRPYRTGMPMSEALREIDLHAGRQFDPAIAAAFVGLMSDPLAAEESDRRPVSAR